MCSYYLCLPPFLLTDFYKLTSTQSITQVSPKLGLSLIFNFTLYFSPNFSTLPRTISVPPPITECYPSIHASVRTTLLPLQTSPSLGLSGPWRPNHQPASSTDHSYQQQQCIGSASRACQCLIVRARPGSTEATRVDWGSRTLGLKLSSSTY